MTTQLAVQSSELHRSTQVPPLHAWFAPQSVGLQHWVAHAHALPTLL